MGKSTVEITYSAKKGLREILVNDDELDISAIQGKPMADWFTASGDEWKGLLPEIHALLGDSSAELDFEFFGTREDEQRFFQCLEESRKKASTVKKSSAHTIETTAHPVEENNAERAFHQRCRKNSGICSI